MKVRFFFRKLLVDLSERRRKVERRQREVQRTEVSGANVFVAGPCGVTVRQQVRRSAAFEIPDGGGDVAIREMNQAVATQNHVDARKLFACQVEQDKLRFVIRVELLVARDEIGNNVGADVVVDVELRVFHPVEITARRIEQRARADLAKKQRQLASQFCGARKVRSWTGYRLFIAPAVLLVKRRKRRCHVCAWR